MRTLDSLRQSILTECEDDHVGLWSVIRDVEEFLPKRDPAAVRDHVLSLLHELLSTKQIKAGYPTPEGGFRSLRTTPQKIIAQIETEWPPGYRPTIGEGLWFTRTKKKDR